MLGHLFIWGFVACKRFSFLKIDLLKSNNPPPPQEYIHNVKSLDPGLICVLTVYNGNENMTQSAK